MSEVLKKLGLTRDAVKQAAGLPSEPGELACVVVNNNYLCGSDQRRIRRRMKEYSTFIVARYLEGWHPGTISRLLSVSEESVRGTLRKTGIFSKSRAGRPSKSESSLQGTLVKDQSKPSHDQDE
jgi:hypothetical protein